MTHKKISLSKIYSTVESLVTQDCSQVTHPPVLRALQIFHPNTPVDHSDLEPPYGPLQVSLVVVSKVPSQTKHLQPLIPDI